MGIFWLSRRILSTTRGEITSELKTIRSSSGSPEKVIRKTPSKGMSINAPAC